MGSNNEIVKNISNLLVVIEKEFDCLGIQGNLDENHIEEIFSKTVKLINIHRKTLNEMSNLKINLAQMKNENTKLQGIVEDNEKKRDIEREKFAHAKASFSNLNNVAENVQKRNAKYAQDMLQFKKQAKHQEDQLKHKITKQCYEIERQNNIINKNIGSHKSQDEIFTEILTKLKDNEENYKKRINQLQNLNRELAEEIFNLRQEGAEESS